MLARFNFLKPCVKARLAQVLACSRKASRDAAVAFAFLENLKE